MGVRGAWITVSHGLVIWLMRLSRIRDTLLSSGARAHGVETQSKSGNSQQSNVARWTAWGQACLDSEDKGTMTRIHDDLDLRHNLSNMLRSPTATSTPTMSDLHTAIPHSSEHGPL